MDSLTSEQRTERMRRVRGKDTRPEVLVRSTIHKLGYRFRKHRKDLPGCPDIVFGSRRKVVFVNGCFWHRHDCPAGRRLPKSRVDFWRAKFDRNVERDIASHAGLSGLGWASLVIWECEARDVSALVRTLRAFLDA